MSPRGKKPVVKTSVFSKITGSWQAFHTMLLIVGMVVGFTVTALNYFVSAADFDKFQKDVVGYQLEDQRIKANDRVIELDKMITSGELSEKERLNRMIEKEKLEKRIEQLDKKIDALNPQYQQKR